MFYPRVRDVDTLLTSFEAGFILRRTRWCSGSHLTARRQTSALLLSTALHTLLNARQVCFSKRIVHPDVITAVFFQSLPKVVPAIS